jgi:hypothetical protein
MGVDSWSFLICSLDKYKHNIEELPLNREAMDVWEICREKQFVALGLGKG